MKQIKLEVSGRSAGGCAYLMRAIRKLDGNTQVTLVVSQGEKQVQVANHIKNDIADVNFIAADDLRDLIKIELEQIDGKSKPFTK